MPQVEERRLLKRSSPPLLLRIMNFFSIPSKQNKTNAKPQIIFILSTGRTGTKFLAKYFDAFEGVHAVHEPRPSWRIRMWSNARFENRVSDQYMEAVLRKYRLNRIKSIDDRFYIESNPFMSGFAKAIPKVFPSAKVVHVVRDPRDYIKSAINHGAIRGLKRILNTYIPYWMYKDSGKRVNDNASRMINRLARFWNKSNNFLLDSGKESDNYYLVKFEDLFSSQAEMERLTNFIGLPTSSTNPRFIRHNKKINKSRFKDVGNWQNWDKETLSNLEKSCSSLMKRFRYKRYINSVLVLGLFWNLPFHM